MPNENKIQKKPDIFDRIMSVGMLKKLQPIYAKNKEMLLYLFFGVLTTAVSFVTAGLSKAILEGFTDSKDIVSTASTVFSWICAVTFAYVTNRVWVFDSEAKGVKSVFSEAISFYGGRILTLLVEMGMMWLGYSLLGINYWITKITANIVVLLFTYTGPR
ncbi:MAG: GtrA family protein, partial [Ruminococcus sp.]|nr:GtrA family protein [Ruminococcus sp.]